MDLGDFGFWGFWILDFGDFGFWILGILDFGFWGRNPKSKIPNPKSKIQTFLADFGDFGFWILDRYVATLYVAPNFGDFGFWGFWILDLGDFGFWIWGFGFWILGILDFGFWGFWGFWILGILDFGFWGFWILDRYVANLYVRPPTPQIWGILDFGDFGFWGFWILDFGDFGFWILGILDFGVWGFWILDFGFCDKFWMLHKKRRLCTPNRVGGLNQTVNSVYNRSSLHQTIFAPEDFYPETVYNKLLSHRKTVTLNSFSTRRPYTRNSLHQTPPASEAVYTKQFLHENPVTATSSFCTNSRLHQTAGWTKKDTCASLRNILSLKVHFRRIKKQ